MLKPIVITGFMGCGKTKVARELARRLNLTMIDLDEAITELDGRSPAQLITEDGERSFRDIETKALRDLLKAGTAGVVALGGGAWIEAKNRELIDKYGCRSVWLDAPFDVCWARIEASSEDRPLSRTREQALALYERRRPVYELASVHVQVTGDNLQDLISSIEKRIATDFHG